MNPTRYPLQWPTGWKRTPDARRDPGRFSKKRTERRGYSDGSHHTWHTSHDVTVSEATQRLLAELLRMGIGEHDVVISTNLQVRLDGLPRSGQAAPQDPGAAVYWRDAGRDRCMAIDRYTKVEQNIAALAATIEAMRAIERHGGATILDRAFTGFTALPAPIVAGMARPWRQVFNFGPSQEVTAEMLRSVYLEFAAQHHPDRGPEVDREERTRRMAEINTARDQALQELTP